MLIKEETIQNLEAQHRELCNQQIEYVKKIQTLEETIVELEKETTVLNENVRLKLIKNLLDFKETSFTNNTYIL